MESSHALALETKHAGLDARIAEELRRPAPDTTLLARLKKQKLKIKEALSFA
jgi:uncharacterized protein